MFKGKWIPSFLACGQHFVTREGNVTFPDNFDTSEGKMCDIVIAPEQTNNEVQLAQIS